MTPIERYGAGGPPVRMRADARRNRVRVLEAAEAVFAAEGVAASTETVARRAGVGVGTVFRHFPTKDALLEAVLAERLRGLAARARALGRADDPGAALFGLLGEIVAQGAARNAFGDAFGGGGEVLVGLRSELLEALDELVGRAQKAGALRGDVGPAEVVAVAVGATHAARWAGGAVGVVLDGLRFRPAARSASA